MQFPILVLPHIELGCDLGIISIYKDVESYFTAYPFAQAGYFAPLGANAGFFAGAGAGFMFGKYTFPFGEYPVSIFGINLTAGVNLRDMLNISYTLRTDFGSFNHKVSAGYTYRFK